MKLNPYLTSYIKINSKWIEGLIMRLETVKLLGKKKKKTGENILDVCLGNDFLAMIPKAHATKAKIDKWDYIKLLQEL